VKRLKTEVLSFRKDILPNSNVLLKERIKDTGRVTEIRVRFYPGQERQLQVKPYGLLTGNRAEDVLTYVGGTETYLTGDNDYFVFPVSLELNMDDEFAVSAVNLSSSYTYTLVCDVVVQYYGGDDL
jgi:hypothetical protein